MSDIFLLTIDSLRNDCFENDTLGAGWDVIESEFTYFSKCYSNGVSTPLSFPSIHTGYPIEGDGTLRPDTQTIAELVDGYCWANTHNSHLRQDRGYDRGFDSFQSSWEDVTEEAGASTPSLLTQTKQILGRSKTVQNVYRRLTQSNEFSDLQSAMQGRDGFFWRHVMKPHSPFEPAKISDRSVDISHSPDELEDINERFLDRCPTDDDLDVLQGLYVEIVEYVGRQLVSFFEHLQSEGRWEDAMVIIMSDHGEAFGEDGVFGHDWSADPIDELIQVPLFIKFPGGKYRGKEFNHMVQNRDLFATLANWFEWSVETPQNSHPLTETGNRIVISKSNTAIRVTTGGGVGIRRRDGTESIGGISPDAREALFESKFPEVKHLSGDIPGLTEKEEKAVEDRLHELGYR